MKKRPGLAHILENSHCQNVSFDISNISKDHNWPIGVKYNLVLSRTSERSSLRHPRTCFSLRSSSTVTIRQSETGSFTKKLIRCEKTGSTLPITVSVYWRERWLEAGTGSRPSPNAWDWSWAQTIWLTTEESSPSYLINYLVIFSHKRLRWLVVRPVQARAWSWAQTIWLCTALKYNGQSSKARWS